MSVPTTPDFSIQKPTLQIPTPLPVPLPVGGVLFPYDVAPDGERFLLAVPIKGTGATPISVRVNWAFLVGSRR